MAAADADPVALAWAIKDRCYAAWSSEPAATAQAADDLAELQHRTAALPDQAQAEIEALACWTRAIAHLAAGAMEPAIASLDAAAALFTRIGRADAAAQTQVPRIMALAMLGRHDAAVRCAEAAQRAFLSLGDRSAAARVSLNLGSLHLRHDAYADAARHYRDAAVLFARGADHEHSVMADIGVADALTAAGDYDDAVHLYRRAGLRAAAHALPVLQALVDESQALLDLARGDYGAALAGFESARRRYAALAMPQHLAIAEKQLADAYLELHLLPEALALYGPALARFDALRMPDDAAWTLAQRGRAQALLGQADAAAASFQAAAALFVEQGSDVGRCAVLLARAELALAGGDAAAALALADQAAAGFAAAGLADGRLRAELAHAQALHAAGRDAAAAAAFTRLLAAAQAAQQVSLQVRCLTGLGLARMDSDTAAARTALLAAVALFEEQRRALPGDDVRNAFLADHLQPYACLLALALRDHARAPTPAHAAAVLHWLDRHRARGLVERLAQRGETDAPSPAAVALRTRLNWLSRRLQRQQDDGDAPPAALEAALRDTERALLELSRRERLAQPVAAVVADDLDIAQALPPLLGVGDAVVEFGIAAGRCFACVVRRGGIDVQHALAPLADVLQALAAARFQIDALRPGAAVLARHLPLLAQRTQAPLQRLHALLWAPLAPALDGCGRVLVVAPAQLAGVPFAALDDGAGPLAARLELTHAPSAAWACATLARQPAPLGPQARAVVVGESSRLPHAAAEAHQVASRFAHATTLLDADATTAALRRHAAGAEVLHLACHAEFRGDNPLFSALHLHDGPLTAEQVEALRLPPGIVVLGACETGLADTGPGDAHVGLVRAFFLAGAARVLASLWPVDDAVTAAGMAHFYRALCSGATAAAALRQAQAALRAEHPHPALWAAFSLYGHW